MKTLGYNKSNIATKVLTQESELIAKKSWIPSPKIFVSCSLFLGILVMALSFLLFAGNLLPNIFFLLLGGLLFAPGACVYDFLHNKKRKYFGLFENRVPFWFYTTQK